MREVCYVRLEEAAGRADDAPAAILVGSSQMLHGVNVGKLAALQPRPVIRRAMFGMAPLKALAMRAYVPFRPGDVCAMYLSEFDFTNQEPFPFDWFRPHASWRTLPDVMRCVPKSTAIRNGGTSSISRSPRPRNGGARAISSARSFFASGWAAPG
jgi:hypothetical protein